MGQTLTVSHQATSVIRTLAGQIALGIYALLLAVSGLIGYVKERSRLSLIAGSIAAVVAVIARRLSVRNNRWGIPLGVLLSFVVLLVCSYRSRGERSKVRLRDHEGELLGKSMQNELLFIVSGMVLGVLAAVRSGGLTLRGLLAFGLFGVLAAISLIKWLRSEPWLSRERRR
jgi:uncharacterized membrane protein (UPF0136 family)